MRVYWCEDEGSKLLWLWCYCCLFAKVMAATVVMVVTSIDLKIVKSEIKLKHLDLH